MKYTSDEKQTVLTLMQRGWDYDQILAVKDYAHFDRQTLRAMKSNAAKAQKGAGDNLQRNETPKNNALQRSNEQKEVKPVIHKNAPATSVFADFVAEWLKSFHPIDLLFYLSALVGCSGVLNALKSVEIVNALVAFVLFGIAFVALHGLKTLRGFKRAPHFLAMLFAEITFFCSDVFWANKALWSNVKDLPLDIRLTEFWSADAGKMKMIWLGQTAFPFYIACCIATILFACAAYACAIALQSKKS